MKNVKKAGERKREAKTRKEEQKAKGAATPQSAEQK